VGAWLRRSLRPLAAGAAMLAAGFLLSAFYLVPAVVEQRWVNIGELLSAGLRPAESFLFTRIDDPEHTVFNYIVSTVAAGMIVLGGAAAAIGRRRWTETKTRVGADCWWLLLAIAAVSTVMMLRLSGALWRWLPKIAFLQFPWRWLFVLAVPMACFLAAAVAPSQQRAIWAALVLALLAGTGWLLTRQAWWSSQDIAVLRRAISEGHGYEGTDEYDPLGDDRTELKQPATRVVLWKARSSGESGDDAAPRGAARVRVELWRPEEKRIVVEAREPVRVALRLLDFPAWQVTVNGRLVRPEKPEQTTQMLIPIARGESRIRVAFTRTRDRTIGLALFLAGVAILLPLLWMRRRPGQR